MEYECIVIDLIDAFQTGERTLILQGGVARGKVLFHAFNIKKYRIGIKGLAIVKYDALTQMEGPSFRIFAGFIGFSQDASRFITRSRGDETFPNTQS